MDLSKFTPEQLQEARLAASQKEKDCLIAYAAGEFRVNDPKEYIARNKRTIRQIEDGELDGNFTIRQRMFYHLTGECPALLP